MAQDQSLRAHDTEVERSPGFVPFAREEVEGSIPRRFAAQVASWPDRPAVRADGATVTYRQLDERANRVAHALLGSFGDTPEAVALLLPQGADLVVAILGVLKAGKYYLGLDASFRPAALSEAISDAGSRTILTTSKWAATAERAAPEGVTVLVMDEPAIAREDRASPAIDVSPDDLAYIFYTSGSTGRSKAVVDCHRNVLHNIMRYTNTLGIGSADRMTLLQSASFSGSVSSLFGALLNGACTLPGDPRATSSRRLARWLVDERVTVYHSVPALFRTIITECEAAPDLRVVRLEGDRASVEDLRLFASRAASHARLVNGLGTTETGLVRQFFFSPSDEVVGDVVPVGYPVPDMDVLVLDDERRPVRAGEVGEIAVRSRYLAVGYWRNPELTESRFLVPDRADERTYLTGDLGRLRADGCLEHLGRKGRQVKIRGHMVELAEVELAMLALPEVADAAVTTSDTGTGAPRLVAYYVTKNRPAPTVATIREALERRNLPFMVPTLFVELPALPLTTHGKLDRSRLPPAGQPRSRADGYVAPRNLLENHIAGIWEQLLGVAPVGVLDDFLDLGGDSLRAMTMLARIESELDEELPTEVLLDNATVEDLAARIRDQLRHSASPVVRVQEGSGGRPFFFLHGDYLSHGYYCRRLAKGMGEHVPFYAVQPSGLNGHRAGDSYEEMAEQHLNAVRAVQPDGPYHLGGTCNGGLVAYELARRLVEQDQGVATLVLFASSARNLRFRAFGLASDLASTWLRLSPGTTQIVIRYLNRLTASLSARGRVGFLYHLLVASMRLPLRLVDRPGVHPADTNHAHAGWEHFQRMDAQYLPRPYPGKVTLVWPTDELETAEEAVSWWRRLSPEVELRKIPVDRQTCLVRRVPLLAKTLESCWAHGPAT
jgi:amino acid adenylation domain-containing protein